MRQLPKKIILLGILTVIVTVFIIILISYHQSSAHADPLIILILATINLILFGICLLFIIREKTHNHFQEQLKRANLEIEAKAATAVVPHFFEHFTDAFICFDKNWNYTYVNKKAAELLIRTPEDLIGRNVWVEYPLAVELSTYGAYYKAFENQEYVYHEHYYQPFDVWIENHIYPSPEGISVVFRDITEKKKAEKKLQHSEAMMAEAQRIAHFGSYEIDLLNPDNSNNDSHVWSDEVFRIFGYEPGQFKISLVNYLKIIHPDDRERVHFLITKAVEEKSQLSSDHRILLPDNSIRWIHEEATIVKDEHSEKAVKIIGTIHDITERKTIEEELIQSEKYNRNLFDHSTVGLALSDMDGRLEDVNETYAKIIGRTIEESKSLTYFEITPEKYSDQEQEMIKELQTYGRYGPYEKEYIHKDGHLIPVRLSGIILERNGQKYIWSSVEDISDQKKAEEKIQKSLAELKLASEQLSSILNSLPAHIALLDESGKIVEINEAWKSFGDHNRLLSNNYCIGDNYIDIANNAAGEDEYNGRAMASAIKEILSGRIKEFSLEYPCDSPHEKRWFRANVTPFLRNRFNGVVISHTNITDHKLAEERIKESEIKYRSFFENSMDGILLTDSTGVILAANPAACKIYGRTEEEILQIGNHELVDVTDPQYYALVEQRQTKGKAKGELTLLHRDGSKFPSEQSSVVFRDIQGNERTSIIFRDITERKKAEKELNESEARLKEAQRLSHIGSWDINIIENKLDWSDEVYRIFDVEVKDVNINFGAFLNYVHPEDKLFVSETRLKSIKEKTGFDIIYRIITAEGTLKYINGKCENFFDDSGTLIRSTGIIQDITTRIKSEQIIKETEARYRNIVETAQEGIWLIDENNYTTFLNKKMCEILEYPSDAIMGRKIHDFMDEEGKANASEQIARRKLGLNENHDSRFITKSGKYLWTSISTNPVFDNEGKYKGALAMVTDITQRKIDEERLQNSFEELQNASQRQSAILNSLPAVIALLDNEGNIIAHNEAWKKLALKFSAGDKDYVIGGNYLKAAENVRGEGAPISKEIARGIRDVINGTKPRYSLEYFHNDLSLQKRWLKVEVTPLSDKTHSGVVVMHLDITNKKTDEEKILQSNERYRLVTLATNDAIWDWNLLTNQIYWSEGYEKLFGYLISHEKETVDTWEKRLHPEDTKRVLYSAQLKLNNPGPDYHWQQEFRYLKIDGNYANVYASGNIVVNENNVPVRVVGSMQDITRRKQAEQERDKTTNDLIQRNSDLEQFAYIVSHNLRAPVANIIGCTDVLNELQLDEQSQKEIMQGLSAAAKKLDRVIWDLNEILQIKRDIKEKKELICFSQLVEDIKVSIASLIQKENVTINSNFKSIDEFLSLKTYMHSIFYNLISNSVKYRRQGISPIIEITSAIVADKLEITFKDNGMGIDLASKGDQVFGLYKRFHHHVEGKGIGLYMSKTQVEAMGGKISIQSEVNKGTIFTILFDI